ncbi:MAG: CPBP family intramembrane metalloprotease [Chloroflexi bacterium CFX2]|nr:CPBP family intramembrane metalloprotease [Chloroflexi bacterium CFX2]
MRTLINWKIYFILLIAAVLSSLAVLPYALALQPGIQTDVSTLIIQQIIQGGAIFAVMIFLGMILMERIGLSTPILDLVTKGESASEILRRILPISIVLGVAVGLVIIGLDFAFRPILLNELGDKADLLKQGVQPAAWKGFLASFSGGIGEEIQLRLFLMSLLAWFGSFISRTSEGKPTSAVFWIANILAAIIFGLGHLPAMATILPLTLLVVIRTVMLNMIGGITFGWLYQTRGLESAMVAHFSADVVLHVLLAL